MQIILFINEKGGVGKTGVCFNSAYYLAGQGKRILMIDFDPQRANLTYHAGIEKPANLTTMYDVLVEGVDIRKAVLGVEENLHIIPATSNVVNLTTANSSVSDFKKSLQKLQNYYDYIFIDVSPTPTRAHGLALGVADYAVIIMIPDVMSLESNMGLASSIHAAQKINPNLKVAGILFNRFTFRAKLSKEVKRIAENMARKMNTKVFETKIRNNVTIREAVSSHDGITAYDKNCNGAKDTISFCNELMMEVNK